MMSRIERILESLPLCALVVVLNGKGGEGKSTIAQTFVHALGGRGHIDCISTDTANSNLNQIGLATLPPVDLAETENIGHLLALADRVGKESQFALVDTGARDEARLLPFLPGLAQRLKRNGAQLTVLRPITASHFGQANALSYSRQRPPATSCLFVRNLGQGRDEKHFQRWKESIERAEALRSGVVETTIDSLGPLIADNATSFNLSLEDVAHGDFRRAGVDQDRAEKLFDKARQLFVAEFLREHGERFRAALIEAARNSGF
ncbi:hypothetical protein AB6806_04695 [Bosea sp. RCC_152_1]|uniref:hypothetical protein n=1 Tax=Bosea sp. RCC_152_1 TaxID=3239228 RepID=UPI003523E504